MKPKEVKAGRRRKPETVLRQLKRVVFRLSALSGWPDDELEYQRACSYIKELRRSLREEKGRA